MCTRARAGDTHNPRPPLPTATTQANFPQLVNNLGLDNTDAWARWATSNQPEASLPSVARGLSEFQLVMVVQTFRPDRLITALSTFVCQVLGVQVRRRGRCWCRCSGGGWWVGERCRDCDGRCSRSRDVPTLTLTCV